MRTWSRVWPWVLVAPLALWALLRLVGWERGPAVLALSFTPWVLLAALIPLAVTLFTRQWWAAGVAGLTCLVLAACVLPRAVGSPSQLDGVPLTVMSVNLRIGEANAEAIVAAVRDFDVDVLAIQELTPSAVDGLARAGLTGLLPRTELHAEDGPFGSGVYTRLTPLSGGVRPAGDGRFAQAYVVVQPSRAAPILVESVHPRPPVGSGPMSLWTAGLRDQEPPGANPSRVLAGDFNSTLDHAELRRVVDTGYRDAAATVGAGLTTTWPYDPPNALVPAITIDHVLVPAGVGVRSFDARTIPDTDHRAIIARLVLSTVDPP